MWSIIFLQGGWELDESIEEAALRETLEEAGVVGDIDEVSLRFHSLYIYIVIYAVLRRYF